MYLQKPVKLKTHKFNSNNYIDLFVVANSHDTFKNGFNNQILVSINWVRNYVDGRLDVINEIAKVTYFTLYFQDNNTDSLIDPVSSQLFIFATETD